MTDALSKFIGGLKTLDPSNLGAPANQDALRQFQSLDGGSQRDVLNGLAGKYNTTFDELASFSAADQNRIAANIQAGRDTFAGIDRPGKQPASFESKWEHAADVARTQSQPTPPAPAAPVAVAQPAPQPAAQPARFEDRWQAATDKSRSDAADASTEALQRVANASFEQRHGTEDARVRNGFVPQEREAQLSRIAAMQSQAKREGKSFGDVADEWVREGK